MTVLAPGVSIADLEFLDVRRVIATGFLQGPDGIAIVDPGPSTTLPMLRRHLAAVGATVSDVTALLVTHIHLDHAGASGTMLRENPRIKVHVHESGAPHLVDPTRLLKSATRLYGEQMQQLWGDVEPVPAGAIVTLSGGERIGAGGRLWDVAHTPGHASHHVSYFCADTGIAFVGDTAGVQVIPGGFVLPPTPPPDINLALWRSSLSTIEGWRPRSLVLTHFGAVDTVSAHLTELRDHLGLVERLARDAMAVSPDDAVREAWFIERVRRDMMRRMSDADERTYEMAGRFDLNWRGMARYLAKAGA
jgi:glyoxylase-like metal-dependent hydrolase (beta-lactamase superfamily II)